MSASVYLDCECGPAHLVRLYADQDGEPRDSCPECGAPLIATPPQLGVCFGEQMVNRLAVLNGRIERNAHRV